MTREEAIVYFEDAKEYCRSVSISTKTTHISAYEMAIEALKHSEQKKGKWVKDKTNQLYCSACGQYGIYSEKVGTLHTFYCPYCGAKMEE